MTHSKRELDASAAAAEAWIDAYDPDTMVSDDIADLQRIGRAIDALEAAEAELQAAVNDARGNGRTWARIGLIFGISRQSAQERFAPRGVAGERRPHGGSAMSGQSVPATATGKRYKAGSAVSQLSVRGNAVGQQVSKKSRKSTKTRQRSGS